MSLHLKGVLALLFSAAVFASYGIYSRMIGLEFGIFAQGWIRNGLVAILLFGLIFFYRKFWKKIRRQDIPLLLVWTISGSLNMVFFFVAVNKLSIGTTYFIAYAFIIVTGFLLGNIFYKEKINIIKIISATLAIIGLSLVCSVTIDKNNLLFIVFAAIVGITASFWGSLSKKYHNIIPTFR